MNPTVTARADGPRRLVLAALLALVAMLASVLVAPPARAQADVPEVTDLLQVSKDRSTWSAGPTPSVLAWTEPFEDMSPGDVSTQEYYLRNVGAVPVRVDMSVLVESLDEYSYLRGRSTLAAVEGDVTERTSVGGFPLVGDGALAVGALAEGAPDADTSTTLDGPVSGAVLAPGAVARVTNTVTVPAEVDRLPAGIKSRFMDQDTRAHLIPRASFEGVGATLSVTRSADTPAVVGEPIDFTIVGAPAAAVAGGTYVVTDADGNEIARVTVGADGTATFTHTFTEPGDHRLTVSFIPADGQGPVESVTVEVTVTAGVDPGPGPGPGPDGPGGGSVGGSVVGGFGSSAGSSVSGLGWLFVIPAVVGAVALLVGGAWYLADEARIPGIPPFPVPLPGFPGAGSSASVGLLEPCRDDDQRQHCRDGVLLADAAHGAPQHGGGPIPLAVVDSSAPVGAVGPVSWVAEDERPWWERVIDDVRGWVRGLFA